MLFFLLLIVALCYAAWIYIQMYALFVLGAAALIFAVVYGVGKAVSKTETGQKFADVLRAGLAWCFKTPIRIMLSIFGLAAMVVVVLISYDSFQPQVSDIKVEYHNWQIEESFMGVPYDVDKYGYFVTNAGDQAAYVKLKITQYGENGNVVEEDEIGCNLPVGGSRLLVFEAEEDAKKVDYGIIEIHRPKYTVLEIGYTKDSDVYFCYDEDDTLIVVNNTGEEIEACGTQIVYFDADDEIIAECSASMGDLRAREQGEDRFYPNYIPEVYARYEIYEWAFSE